MPKHGHGLVMSIAVFMLTGMTWAVDPSAPFPAFTEPTGFECAAKTCGIPCPTDCNDGVNCTRDVCDTTTGTCTNTLISCNDGNSQTKDVCNPDSTCLNYCWDYKWCTTNAGPPCVFTKRPTGTYCGWSGNPASPISCLCTSDADCTTNGGGSLCIHPIPDTYP